MLLKVLLVWYVCYNYCYENFKMTVLLFLVATYAIKLDSRSWDSKSAPAIFPNFRVLCKICCENSLDGWSEILMIGLIRWMIEDLARMKIYITKPNNVNIPNEKKKKKKWRRAVYTRKSVKTGSSNYGAFNCRSVWCFQENKIEGIKWLYYSGRNNKCNEDLWKTWITAPGLLWFEFFSAECVMRMRCVSKTLYREKSN